MFTIRHLRYLRLIITLKCGNEWDLTKKFCNDLSVTEQEFCENWHHICIGQRHSCATIRSRLFIFRNPGVSRSAHYAWTMQSLTLATIIAAEKQGQLKLWQSHGSVKCRSRAPGQSACWKGMLRTITIQGLTLTAFINAQKRTSMLGST